MRISEYYKLNRTQASLDFVDVDIHNDVKLYIDPSSFEIINSEFSDKCRYLIKDYFNTLLKYIRNNNIKKAEKILIQLKEPNETHLGLSVGESRGRGLGPFLATQILDTLKGSNAVKSGLLQNIEETALMIEGISYDIISDIVTNIIRAELISYTNDMCEIYKIPLSDNITIGPLWDTKQKNWVPQYVSLPMADNKPLLLVPKSIVRKKANYDIDEYYQYYILDFLQTKEIKSNSGLVKILKNGKRIVTKKSIKAKYGTEKKSLCISQTINNPEILEEYRNAKQNNISEPLDHEEFSIIENSPNIDYKKVLSELKKIPTGTQHATKYENKIEELISAIFSPDLAYPKIQHPIHEGRKRIDITYTNVGREKTFFSWLSTNYPASHIFIECKNYSVDLKNPEFDQLAGRFSPSRGKIGFLICRKNENPNLALERCKDTAKDDRGYIIVLEDKDFDELVDIRQSMDYRKKMFSFLKNKFDFLIM
ncbi:hypothetical protein Q6A87_08575 [Aliarcobacter skirrowii]|uniref:hypothetical protein n=1 Tax=Aliarcobacter TaxID=2321111 RepID=UPI0021B6B811|nr:MULTISPECIES: hypothetical protein [Aliarcobacter]MCT7509273.1 hypothetical protein [Aliarcobacter cryaerophilus]MDX4067902.1 hypothetical protein [Aliarcobacter skirrowii]